MNAHRGMDVSKARLDVVLLRDDHAPEVGRFDNTDPGLRNLQRFLKKRKLKTLQVCLEATGYCGDAVARFLHQLGYTRQRGQPGSPQRPCRQPPEPQ